MEDDRLGDLIYDIIKSQAPDVESGISAVDVARQVRRGTGTVRTKLDSLVEQGKIKSVSKIQGRSRKQYGLN